MMKSLLRALITSALVSYAGLTASAVELKDGHPDVYYVKQGDTLWDISSSFLDSPWQWPELWHVNQEIENPHLIYPGDVIRLVYVDGKPRLMRRVCRHAGQRRPPPDFLAAGVADRVGHAG